MELAKNDEGTIQQPVPLVIPQCPAYFKTAELKGISENVITLDISTYQLVYAVMVVP